MLNKKKPRAIWKPTSIKFCENFNKQLKKLKFGQKENEIRDGIKEYFKKHEDLFAERKISKKVYDLNAKVFIYLLRIDNPTTSKGTSGGLRCLVLYVIDKHIAEMHTIYKRNDLERRKKTEYHKYVDTLKKEVSNDPEKTSYCLL